MFEITMQNGEVNDTYFGSIEDAPSSFSSLPDFLSKHQFIVLNDTSGKQIILNTKNIISITNAN